MTRSQFMLSLAAIIAAPFTKKKEPSFEDRAKHYAKEFKRVSFSDMDRKFLEEQEYLRNQIAGIYKIKGSDLQLVLDRDKLNRR